MKEKERAVATTPEGRARYNQIKGSSLEMIKAGLKQATITRLTGQSPRRPEPLGSHVLLAQLSRGSAQPQGDRHGDRNL